MSEFDKESLPTERDFDPYSGDLDAQTAWRNFGGLTVEQADARFHENPCYHQEDFMFMGGKAFAYYFPVVESYLRSGEVDDEKIDNAWILSHCIQIQFLGKGVDNVRHLAPKVLDLAAFVLSNLHRFSLDLAERQQIADAWKELTNVVESNVKA